MAVVLSALGGLTGCATVKYLVQAGKGQLALLNRARPIEEVLRDETVSPRTRALLAHVSEVKAFGEKYGLKPTANYREFVQLDRPAAVYVVSACEELEFKPKAWKFPIVGSFPYLGWFSLDDARAYAQELRAEGWDVDLRGASAYSTLGWFRDAVLSSMLPESDEAVGDLVDVVIHESLHATIYVNDQSTYNESLASFVAEGLAPEYLRAKLGPGSREEKAYLEGLARGERNRKRLHQAYLDLKKVYDDSGLTPERKREKKARYLAVLREELGWKRDLSNATLMAYKTYGGGKEVFAQAFQKCGSDWRRFLSSLSRIQPESFSVPQQEDLAPVLGQLIGSSCR